VIRPPWKLRDVPAGESFRLCAAMERVTDICIKSEIYFQNLVLNIKSGKEE
jgi:hypothetical protein